jgi:hypothetical protein
MSTFLTGSRCKFRPTTEGNKALAIDADSVKALFRRGSAYLEQSNYPDAKADLKRCIALDAGNKGAKNALAKVQKKIDAEKAKAKSMFGGMFDKMGAQAQAVEDAVKAKATEAFAARAADGWIDVCGDQSVRCAFSDRNLHSRMPLDPARIEHVCDQWHSSRVSTPLTSWHCKLRPNTEGAEEDFGSWRG